MKKVVLFTLVTVSVGFFFGQLSRPMKPAFADGNDQVRPVSLGEEGGLHFSRLMDRKNSIVCYSTFYSRYQEGATSSLQCFKVGPGSQN